MATCPQLRDPRPQTGKVHEVYNAIRRYARLHDPFNHPTVVFRRSAVQAAGGYGDFPMMEDYSLWARMLLAGGTCRGKFTTAGARKARLDRAVMSAVTPMAGTSGSQRR